MPRHGYVNRLDGRPGDLTAEELATYGSETADILHGLGEQTTVMGLSAGGNVAAWIAYNRADIGRSVVIAPAIIEWGIPRWLGRAQIRLAAAAPNQLIWWDNDLRERIPGPQYAAPLVYSHEVEEQFRLGQSLLDLADRAPPLTPITMILVENDDAISNAAADDLLSRAARHGGKVDRLIVPSSLTQEHDIIDPTQPYANVGQIYPILFEAITGNHLELWPAP
jgi:pimeloyl-ACP methyl ester carboxylesterase